MLKDIPTNELGKRQIEDLDLELGPGKQKLPMSSAKPKQVKPHQGPGSISAPINYPASADHARKPRELLSSTALSTSAGTQREFSEVLSHPDDTDHIIREAAPLTLEMFKEIGYMQTPLSNIDSLRRYLHPIDNSSYRKFHPGKNTDIKDTQTNSPACMYLSDRRTFDATIRSKCLQLDQACSFLNHYYRQTPRISRQRLTELSGIKSEVLDFWSCNASKLIGFMRNAHLSSWNSRSRLGGDLD